MFRRMAKLGMLSALVALLAFVQNRVMVQLLGAGELVDSYYLAMTLPMAAVAVLGVASLTLLVPMFARRPEAGPMVGGAGLGFVMAALVAALMVAQAPFSVWLGFWDPATNGWGWLIVVAVGAALYGFSYYGQVLAVAVERADWYVWSQIANATTFIALLAFGLVHDVTSLAFVFAAGALVQAAAVTIPLLRTGALDLRDRALPPGLVRLVRTGLVASLVGTALMQGSIAVDRWFAESLGTGVLTTYYVGDRMIQMALMLVNTAIGLVVFARMAASERDAASAIAGKTVGGLVVLLAPVTSVLWVYAPGIVQLLFGGGRFDAAAVALTATFMRVLALGLVPMAIVYVMPRRLHASEEFRMFAIVAGALFVGNLAAKYVLTRQFGVDGLAPATVVVYVACGMGYLLVLWRRGMILLPAGAARDMGVASGLAVVHAVAVGAVAGSGDATWAAPLSFVALLLLAAAAGGRIEREFLGSALRWARRA